MKASRSRSKLVIVLVVGLVLGVAASLFELDMGWLFPLMGAVFAVSGLVNLVVAALLGSGVLAPSRRWGASPIGQALLGAAWLSCAFPFVRESFHVGPIPWPLALLPGVVLVIGGRLDQQARVQHNVI